MSDEQRYTRDKNACNTWIIKWYPLDNYFHHLYFRKIKVSLTKCRCVVAENEKFEWRNFFEDTKKLLTSWHEIMINWNANMNSWNILVDLNDIPINKRDFMVINDFFSSALQYFLQVALAVGEFSKYKNRVILTITYHNENSRSWCHLIYLDHRQNFWHLTLDSSSIK